jgi:hypothetical protein
MRGGISLLAFIMATVNISHAANQEWQQWTELSYSQTVDYSLQPSLRLEMRFEDDLSEFAYYEVEPMLTWRYSPRWDFAVGYERDHRIEPMEEIDHVPNLNAWMKVPLKEWTVLNRFRTEFVFPEADEDERFVYRNRTELQKRWKMGGKEVSAYVFDEWFLNFNEGEITENRAGVGFSYPVAPHWNFQAYLMRMDNFATDEWNPVLGLQIQTMF